MEKYIYDESNGLWYELQGDYYIPCLTLLTEKEHKPIGLWGQRHKRYLQEHNKIFYTTLLTSGKLYEYLVDVDKQTEERFERLVEQMKQSQGITEQLKSENALEWVQRMNNIQACARVIVNKEIKTAEGKSSAAYFYFSFVTKLDKKLSFSCNCCYITVFIK